MRQADAIALVVPNDLPGVVAAQRCRGWLQGLGLGDRVRVILAATDTAAVSPVEAAAALGPVFAHLPRDARSLAAARNLGRPGDIPRSPLATALADVVDRWGGVAPGAAAPPVTAPRWYHRALPLRGLLGRWPLATT